MIDFRSQITDRLALDGNLSSGRVLLPSTVGTYPISFVNGASAVLDTQTVGGGQMGANGYVRGRFFGVLALTAGRTLTMAEQATASTVTTTNITTGITWTFDCEVLVQNLNDETTQATITRIDISRTAGGELGTWSQSGYGALVNTASDWTWTPYIDLSGTGSQADVRMVSFEVQYAP